MIKLANGLAYKPENNIVPKGSIFEYPLLKNDLDIDQYADKYNINDYIYTDFNYELQNNLKIDLEKFSTSSDNKFVYYLSSSLNNILNNNNLSFSDFILFLNNRITNKTLKYKFELIFQTDDKENYLESLLSSHVNKLDRYIDSNSLLNTFILIAALRLQITNTLISTNNVTIKLISYKFNKSNEHHMIMMDNLIEFFKQFNIDFNMEEYDKYYYINLICEPLVNLFESFQNNPETLLKLFEKEQIKYFISKLMEYTNNNFHCDNLLSTVLIKYSMAYKVPSFRYTIKNSKFPYALSLYDLDKEYNQLVPDIIEIDDGYLVRIIDIA